MAEGTGTEEIFSAYLYYFEPSAGSGTQFYEYFDIDEHIRDPMATIERLARNAFDNGKAPPPYCDGGQDFIMRRKSYLIFVVADDKHIPVKDEIRFHSISHGNDGGHTFRPAGNFAVQAGVGPAAKVLNVIYCVNDMARWQGGDLEYREFEDFSIELPFEGFAAKGPGTGGTNMGPPVPPPVR